MTGSGAIEVTPEMARTWLWNSQQDGCHLARARDFMHLMDEGKWCPDGRGTSVKVKGLPVLPRVTNGHHRMLAVLLLGKPVQMRVMMMEGG